MRQLSTEELEKLHTGTLLRIYRSNIYCADWEDDYELSLEYRRTIKAILDKRPHMPKAAERRKKRLEKLKQNRNK